MQRTCPYCFEPTDATRPDCERCGSWLDSSASRPAAPESAPRRRRFGLVPVATGLFCAAFSQVVLALLRPESATSCLLGALACAVAGTALNVVELRRRK